MRIEKLNDNQIKFILSESDLSERSLKIEELVIPNDKTQKLFRDIMDKALEEYGFESVDTPLMVEAVPEASDGIMIIVTRLKNVDDAKEKFSSITDAKNMRRFKRIGIKKFVFDDTSEEDKDLLVYSFNTLDDVINLALRINDEFGGNGSLYKLNQKYFLVLPFSKNLELILGDYGTKHISNSLSKMYLKEHGEAICERSAIGKLAKSFL